MVRVNSVLHGGIEVGHIFQLGDKYSKKMNATVLNDSGKSVVVSDGLLRYWPLLGLLRQQLSSTMMIMVSFGPDAMAPFQVALVPIHMHKSYRVREVAELLYEQMRLAGIEVLMDDRKERPGVMFSTMDLIGIPHRIVISERGLDEGTVEYKARADKDSAFWQI